MLKTQVEEVAANKVALTVEVEKEKVKQAYTRFFQRAAASINIPGFRKGKAPRPVLAKFIGPDAIKSQIEEELVEEMYPKAVREANLRPVSAYTIEESNLEEGSPFTFKAVFEVRPTLGEFDAQGYSVQVQRAIVDDESVEKVLQQLREQYSKSVPVEDGTLEVGDYFSAKIDATCDGDVDTELSEENAYHRLNDENRFYLPMKGMKPGETREYDVTVDDPDAPNHGETVHFTVALEKISRQQAPELTDELAKQVGDFASLAELRAKIKTDLEERAENDAEERAFDSIMQQIIEKFPFDVPETMIQNTIDYFIQSLDQRWRQFGMSLQDYLRKSGQDYTAFRETFRDKAVQQTKVMLLVETIGDREDIRVTDADYRSEIEERAKHYGMPVEKLMTTLASGEGEADVKFSLRSRKIREFLLKNNQVNYDMVS